MQLPIARTTDLIEQNLDTELLIYDLRIDKAYTLDQTLSNVYQACDGEQSFEDLRRKHNYTDDLIHLALQELKRSDLIEGYAVPARFAGLTRREVIRKVGLTTMVALPVIASITAPKAIRAASNQFAQNFCEEVECPYATTQCENDGVCDPATGDCIVTFKAAGTPCDDGDATTTGDVCDGSGNCVGRASV